MGSLHEGWLDQIASVLETLNQGVILNDSSKRVVYANSMFLEMIRMDAGKSFVSADVEVDAIAKNDRGEQIGHIPGAGPRESLAGMTLPRESWPTRQASLTHGLSQSRSSVSFSTLRRFTP